ncbi:SDR family NAD(P)-dependent oxidoreductase [Streptomyces sp. NPDC001941]|uniref:SDR family NAD(P)-dependent oxidoreductase n=1 Tax=Streptomyces sp. NPDC001941 TaxID=3154659 RepID=UPI003322F41F
MSRTSQTSTAPRTPRVWFVTGSSRGLGRAVVTTALEDGDRVVATARTPERLDDLVARFGDRVHPVALDVTDERAVLRVVEEGLEVFGRYDVVVNNAGYGDLAAVEDTTMEAFRAQIDTNFYGVVHVSKAMAPVLRRQGYGHVLQVSSLGGRIASPGLTAYQSAKWAVGGFSLGLAQELAPFGVRVTVLEPGGMRTDWAGSSMTVPPVSEPYRATVGLFADMIRNQEADAVTAATADPARVARIIADLAGRDDAPARLLLGRDAVGLWRDAAQELSASDEKWREVSESAWV